MTLTSENQKDLLTLDSVIRQQLQTAFVGKNEVIDLLLVTVLAGEHLLLLGPPGTAKSALLRRFVQLIGGKSFEYLLTRFTEPNELFGPVDIELFTAKKRWRRLTAGMLPEADLIFLDEIFKANSAILNSLLTVMNERLFYNGIDGAEGENGRGPGVQAQLVPVLSVLGASNELPDDPELQALVDRFPVRVLTGNVPEEATRAMLGRAWELEKENQLLESNRLRPLSDPAKIRSLRKLLPDIDTSEVLEPLLRFVAIARAQGFDLSDRRALRLLRLAAASALLQRRTRCTLQDLWVLRHSWSHPQEAETTARLVREVAGDAVLRDEARPLEEIAREVVSQQSLLPMRSTDPERLAALHRLHTLLAELEVHPGDAADRRRLQEQLRGIQDRLMTAMQAVV